VIVTLPRFLYGPRTFFGLSALIFMSVLTMRLAVAGEGLASTGGGAAGLMSRCKVLMQFWRSAISVVSC